MCIIGIMLEVVVEFIRFYNELFLRNLVEKVVNGLNSIMCLLFRMWVLICGIDIGGVLMDVLL